MIFDMCSWQGLGQQHCISLGDTSRRWLVDLPWSVAEMRCVGGDQAKL